MLEIRGPGNWDAANTTVTDAAIARAQRWATIQDLQSRSAGLEGDAQDQDDLANQLEHTGKGKNDAMTKLFNAVGSVPAVSTTSRRQRIAPKRHACVIRWLKIEDQSIASVPAP